MVCQTGHQQCIEPAAGPVDALNDENCWKVGFNPSSLFLPFRHSRSLSFFSSLPPFPLTFSYSFSLFPSFSFYVLFLFYFQVCMLYNHIHVGGNNFHVLFALKIFTMGKSEWQSLVMVVAIGGLPLLLVSRNCSTFTVCVYIIVITNFYICFFTFVEKIFTHKRNIPAQF